MAERIKSLNHLLTVDFNEHDINAQRRFRKSVASILNSVARRLNGFGPSDNDQGTVLLGSDGILKLWDITTETYRPVVLDDGALVVNEPEED